MILIENKSLMLGQAFDLSWETNYENGFEIKVIVNEIELMVWKWLLKWYWKDGEIEIAWNVNIIINIIDGMDMNKPN